MIGTAKVALHIPGKALAILESSLANGATQTIFSLDYLNAVVVGGEFIANFLVSLHSSCLLDILHGSVGSIFLR